MSLEDLYLNGNKNLPRRSYDGLSKLTIDTSRLNIDNIPSRYNVNGRIITLKDTSRLNIDVVPKKYHP